MVQRAYQTASLSKSMFHILLRENIQFNLIDVIALNFRYFIFTETIQMLHHANFSFSTNLL